MLFNKKLYGNVTILLTLTLTTIICVIFNILESARITSIKTYYTDVSQLAADSLFGNYCYELFEDYGLFAINPADINCTEYLSSIAKENISPNIPTDIFSDNYNFLQGQIDNVEILSSAKLTDNDGAVFYEQVKSYMKYKEPANISQSIISASNSFKVDIPDFTNQNQEKADIDLSILDNPPMEDRRECLDISNSQAPTYKQNMSDHIANIIQHNLLLLLVDNTKEISTTTVDKLTLPSLNTQLSDEASVIGEGYIKSNEHISLERIAMEEYVSSIFNCYTNKQHNSLLSYELEYIINGAANDDANILNTAIKLIFMRASLNASYIISNSAKRTAAHDLAKKCTGGGPISTAIAEFAIISSWSTAEGIIDVKDLLAGKKVPLIKDSKTWTLSLDGITRLPPDTISANNGKEGYDYCFYLKLLLTAQNELALRFRTMDLIQLDMSLNYNESFRINSCICGAYIKYSYSIKKTFFSFGNFGSTNFATNYDIATSYNYQ